MSDQKLGEPFESCTGSDAERAGRIAGTGRGYDAEERTWDLIVRYSGTPEELADEVVSFTPLLNNYAIVTIRQSRLGNSPEIRL